MFHSYFPMLYILHIDCLFLSGLFYVPKKTGIVHTWICEYSSVEKWHKIRHGIYFPKSKSWVAEQCVFPLVPLFCYSTNACDMFIHRDTFHMLAERSSTEISNSLFVLISLFTQALKYVFLVEPIWKCLWFNNWANNHFTQFLEVIIYQTVWLFLIILGFIYLHN